ncbi:MAG TPA: carboxypeptidase regulatory-like domain-containing protein [Candidatus Polarisedimenticolaceae bacterium]|nr:carboxypeptidase regulatory-like domain-containing protein [Candidatus Polarisedimenticolaceae bacterium]
MRLLRFASALSVVALAVTAAMAQGAGGMVVRVADSAGQPLPGATVTISHPSGFIKETASMTDVKGIVEFPVLRASGSPGYTVQISFPGFATARFANLAIKIGETTQLPVQLQEEMVETVKITAKTDTVELEKTTSSTKFSDEFIQDLPVAGRFYQNVLVLAPGVNDPDGDGNPTVHGSRSRDFKAVVGGVSNVDPLTGQQMSEVNPNSIEEMEVITSGAGVEFGRAQGGFANIIQKQGSNDFEGVFEFFWRTSLLDGSGAADTDRTSDPHFDWLQPSVQVSGPIVKDKLWYVLSHEYINNQLPVNVTSGIVISTQKQGIHSDAITWQASPRNKLELRFESDPFEQDNFGVSSLTPPASAVQLKRGTQSYKLTWTAPYSPKILVDTIVGYQDLSSKRLPTTTGVQNDCVLGDPFLENANCFNAETGQVSGSNALSVRDNRQRFTMSSQATVYAGKFWGASHQFKLGLSIENERFFRAQTFAPRMLFIPVSTQDEQTGNIEERAIVPTTLSLPRDAEIRATGIDWSLYAEDQLKPRQNLVITVGVRVDREEITSNGRQPFDPEAEARRFIELLNDPTVQRDQAAPMSFTAFESLDDFIDQLAATIGVNRTTVQEQFAPLTIQSTFWQKNRRSENIHTVNTNFSPALAISWDPWSNGKTAFKATARRYYDKIFLSIPLVEIEPPTTTLVFDARPQGESWLITGLAGGISPAVNISTVQRNLKTPYQDEFTLAFERDLFTETSLRLEYVRRKYRDQLQDIDLNHVPGDFGRCVVDTPTTEPIQEVTAADPDYNPAFAPGDGIIDDCVGDLERIALTAGEPQGNDPVDLTDFIETPDGIPDAYLQNPGWGDIYLLGNFNRADYTGYIVEITRRQYRSWEFQGSYTWSKATGNGEDYGQLIGDDRSQLADEQGYQSNDQRHFVRFNATTITPWGIRLGGALSWQSGLPYSLLTRRLAFDAVPPVTAGFGGGAQGRPRTIYPTHERNDQRNDSYWNLDLRLSKEMSLSRGLNLQLSAEVFNVFNDGTYMVYNPFSESGQQINGANDAQRRFGRRWQLGVKVAF